MKLTKETLARIKHDHPDKWVVLNDGQLVVASTRVDSNEIQEALHDTTGMLVHTSQLGTELTPEEIAITQSVHKRIVGFLTTRYLTVAILLPLIVTLAGFVVGFLSEKTLLQPRLDVLVSTFEKDIKERQTKLETAYDTTTQAIDAQENESRDLLNEMKATKDALNLVLAGTAEGVVTRLTADATQLKQQADKCMTQYKDIVSRPELQDDQLDALLKRVEKISRLELLLNGLEELLVDAKHRDANALAGAFFRIDELVIRDLRAFILFPETAVDALQNIEKNQSIIKATVELRDNDSPESRNLRWTDMQVQLTKTNHEVKKSDQYIRYALSIVCPELPNQVGWWSVSKTSDAIPLKKFDLRGFSNFDELRLSLCFVGSDSTRELAADLQRTSFGFSKTLDEKECVPLEAYCKMLINRQEVELAFQNYIAAEQGETHILDKPLFGLVDFSETDTTDKEGKPQRTVCVTYRLKDFNSFYKHSAEKYTQSFNVTQNDNATQSNATSSSDSAQPDPAVD